MLVTPGAESSLEKAVMMIKGGSAHKIKKQLIYSSPIWMEGFHDRWIRDIQEYRMRKQYIEHNPVNARLVERSSDYALGSCSGKFPLDDCEFDKELQGLKP